MTGDGQEKAPNPLDALETELRDKYPPGGDPGAAVPEAPPAELLDENTIRLFLAMPFDYIAARKGEHWKLSPEESAAIAPLAVKVANKYAPAILARWADEIALVAVLGVILFKRVNIDAAQAEKPVEKPAEGSPVAPVAG